MDAREIEKCIDEFGTDIYRFCLKLCMDKSEAEDLYQQTFLKALEIEWTLDWGQNPNGVMVKQETHHLKFIIAGIISMVLMLVCLTGFIVSAATGNGVNTDVTSNDRVWNLGVISMNSNTYLNGVWKLDFRSASDGFVEEQDMKVEDADTQMLYADISCETVPEGATLVLWLVQDEVVKSVDVTNLSEPLEYPLNDFENGEIHVRLQINGVEDTVSEIYVK